MFICKEYVPQLAHSTWPNSSEQAFWLFVTKVWNQVRVLSRQLRYVHRRLVFYSRKTRPWVMRKVSFRWRWRLRSWLWCRGQFILWRRQRGRFRSVGVFLWRQRLLVRSHSFKNILNFYIQITLILDHFLILYSLLLKTDNFLVHYYFSGPPILVSKPTCSINSFMSDNTSSFSIFSKDMLFQNLSIN